MSLRVKGESRDLRVLYLTLGTRVRTGQGRKMRRSEYRIGRENEGEEGKISVEEWGKLWKEMTGKKVMRKRYRERKNEK